MVSFFWGSSGLAYFLIINLLSYIVVTVLCMRRIGLDKFNTSAFFSFDILKQLFNYGIKSHFGNIFKQLSYRIDVVIIAYFLPLKELGLYAVAVTFSEVIWKVPEAIGIVLLPTISADKNISSFQITARVSRMILFPMLLVCGCIFFFSGIILKLLFGEEFVAAQQCVKYLLPGTLFFSLWKIYVNDLIARGEAIIYSYSSFISATIIIGLNFILLPRIGIIGASISSSAGYIFATAFVMWKFKSYSSISLSNMIVIKKSELQMLFQQPALIINKVFK
jgi:O-antigen/teichoic acid export membrane protein